MTVWPIMERELRTQGRRPFTYFLRVIGATLLLGATGWFGLKEGFGLDSGSRLFAHLNSALFWSIWILVPLLPADCISREKREGTLGLLFLTPLHAGDIILAKSLVHGLRALTLWLAVLPVLLIPFPLGGVTWKEAVVAAATDLSCLFWALAAGILASSLARSWSRAVVLSYFFAICFLLAFFHLKTANLLAWTRNSARISFPWEVLYEQGLRMGVYGSLYPSHLVQGVPIGRLGRLFAAEAMTCVISAVALVLVANIAALRLNGSWQDRPVPRWRLWLDQKMCTPVVMVGFFKRWLRRKLERNPIGWLEQRSWTGRVVMWGWFAVTVSMYSLAFSDEHGLFRIFRAMQSGMAWLLILSLGASAAGSFRRERETGVLELLLVSPISESAIIGGRLKGLWGQFLPASIMLVGVWFYFGELLAWEEIIRPMVFCVSSFITLPVVGLYFSVRQPAFISAFLYTVFFGLVLPAGAPRVLTFLVELMVGNPVYYPLLSFMLGLFNTMEAVIVLQLAVAALFGLRLSQDLARRNFAFSRV